MPRNNHSWGTPAHFNCSASSDLFHRGPLSREIIPAMATRTLHLISSRNASSQRAHFAIYVPSADPQVGTVIHAVGAPMRGYNLEFKRNHRPYDSVQPLSMYPIGDVSGQHIADFPPGGETSDNIPTCALEEAAKDTPPPKASQNFLAPVNDVSPPRLIKRREF